MKLKTKDILQAVFDDPNYKEVVNQMASVLFSHEEHERFYQQEEKAIKFVSNPNMWKRRTKQRLQSFVKNRNVWDGTPAGRDTGPEFDTDVVDWGTLNKELNQKAVDAWVDSKYDKKSLPMERWFEYDYDVGVDFTLVVYTTADDTEIICWTVSVD